MVRPGTGFVSLGTSGVLFVPSATLEVDPGGALHAFCHAVPGQYHLMGVILSAGGALRWYRDVIAPGETLRRAHRGGRRRSLPAPTAWSSCRTSRASARRTWTRMRAAPGSG